ncbi:MAG TPA: hypothetical protein VGN78_05415 [Solirubrobacteraceae bacterium]|jgi:hypothetical protein|nr:hypothetical protein [Solirubrobacteraceae bacterium]
MGLFDVISGKRKLKQPAPDRVFAMSTAYVTLQTELELTSRGVAGIVFQALETSDFTEILRDMEEVVRATAADTGGTVEDRTDSFGYRWMILRDNDFEDLVVGVNAVGTAIQAGGYGDRLLAAVFAFEDAQKRAVYFIYNYKRGTFYPFVPAGDKTRDNERELRLKAQLSHEMPIEPELERWFPLWDIPI